MKEVFWVSYVLLWVVVAVQGLAFLEALRQMAALRRRVGADQGAALLHDAVDTGAPLPELVGADLVTGEPTAWERYLRHDLGVAVFVTPRCPTCHEVAEGLSALWHGRRHEVDLVTIVHGRREEVRKFADETELPKGIVVVDEEGAMAESLGISVNPGAMSIRAGRIGVAGIVNNAHQVESLIDREVSEPSTGPPALEEARLPEHAGV